MPFLSHWEEQRMRGNLTCWIHSIDRVALQLNLFIGPARKMASSFAWDTTAGLQLDREPTTFRCVSFVAVLACSLSAVQQTLGCSAGLSWYILWTVNSYKAFTVATVCPGNFLCNLFLIDPLDFCFGSYFWPSLTFSSWTLPQGPLWE